MPTIGKLQMDAMVQTPIVEPQQVNTESIMAPQSRKHTLEQTPDIYKLQNSWKLNSVRETYLWTTHGIIGISMKRQLRWRLLLQHSGKANNTSRVPWCQWWQ